MEEDRIVTELGNTMLKRRDMRLEQLPHGTSDSIKRKMREAPFDSKFLFGDNFSDLLKEEAEKRKEDLIFTIPALVPKVNFTKPQGSQQQKRTASSPPRGAPAPYTKKFHKGKSDFSKKKGKKYIPNFSSSSYGKGSSSANGQGYGSLGTPVRKISSRPLNLRALTEVRATTASPLTSPVLGAVDGAIRNEGPPCLSHLLARLRLRPPSPNLFQSEEDCGSFGRLGEDWELTLGWWGC